VSKGAVVFISAGNEANDEQHYSNTVSANTTTDYIQVNVTGAGTGDKLTGFAYNLVWYDGTSTRNDLELKYYNNYQVELTSVTSLGQFESNRGTESEYSHYNSYLPTGSYACYLKVKNNSGNSQFFHLYYDAKYNYPDAGSVTFENADPDYTIGSPADADSAITVGSYTTRKNWTDYKGAGHYFINPEQTVDTITSFSSRGPRVDTGAPPKPNIVAPGSAIISCRDNDVYPWPNPSYDALIIDNDGLNLNGSGPADYYVMQGTSMATPHAAGVAALILDKNPTWTPAQVKHALESTATDKGASDWDNVYGWGLIDALAAVNSSLPTWESYKGNYGDSGGAVEDYFDDYETEHRVYMYGTDFNPDSTYKVIYWDGAIKRMVDNGLTPSADGKLKSSWIFEAEQATAGDWQVTVYTQYANPSSYSAADPNIVVDDTSYGNHAFYLTESAIPEFPSVLAAISPLALCSGIYLWMKRRLRNNP
ncbi:MAG TPA: S8 family serine peptidase, partial [Dehalococcoidales bacterium]|nr:S8 family serine peptidase [Dehalococcoidales bacterium]